MSVEAPPAPAAPVKQYRFRILSGTWWKPEPVKDPDSGQVLKDKDGKVMTKDVIYGPGRPAGDIVTTDKNLARLHNKPGSVMFQLLDEDNNPLVGQLKEAEERMAAADARIRKMLRLMNQRELIDYATAEGIDLRGETAKEKVRKIILTECGIDPRDPDS